MSFSQAAVSTACGFRGTCSSEVIQWLPCKFSSEIISDMQPPLTIIIPNPKPSIRNRAEAGIDSEFRRDKVHCCGNELQFRRKQLQNRGNGQEEQSCSGCRVLCRYDALKTISKILVAPCLEHLHRVNLVLWELN